MTTTSASILIPRSNTKMYPPIEPMQRSAINIAMSSSWQKPKSCASSAPEMSNSWKRMSSENPIGATDEQYRCRYKSRRCLLVRDVKRNGQLHSLCKFHREKANYSQRKVDRRKRREMKLRANSVTSETKSTTAETPSSPATSSSSKTSPPAHPVIIKTEKPEIDVATSVPEPFHMDKIPDIDFKSENYWSYPDIDFTLDHTDEPLDILSSSLPAPADQRYEPNFSDIHFLLDTMETH